MPEIILTTNFARNLRKLNQIEQKQVKKKLELLMKDPMYPSLRTKRIQGTAGLFESSVNMDIRLVWCIKHNCIILMLDVGHHDILNKF